MESVFGVFCGGALFSLAKRVWGNIFWQNLMGCETTLVVRDMQMLSSTAGCHKQNSFQFIQLIYLKFQRQINAEKHQRPKSG